LATQVGRFETVLATPTEPVTQVPLVVVHGARPGPTVWVSAGARGAKDTAKCESPDERPSREHVDGDILEPASLGRLMYRGP